MPLETVAAKNAMVEDYRPLLSNRENEVLDCMLSGWKNRETALELDIAEQTVKNYVNRIRRVTGLPRGTHFKKWIQNQPSA